jgi:hypothetical protein
MQTYHAQATVGEEGKVLLSLPFPKGQRIEILVRPESADETDNEAWSRLALESFFKDESDRDAMYDHYDEWRAKNIDSAK